MASSPAPTQVDPLFSPEFRARPEAVISRLRRDDPIHWVSELGVWVATRYDDVRALFSEPRATPDRRAWEHHRPAPAGSFMRWVSENGFFSAPPEQHARLRRLVSAALTPRAVQRMEDQIREVVEQFAAPLRGRTGVVDLIPEFTDPIPNTVISRITGIPAKGADEARFRQIARDALSGINPLADAEAQRLAEASFSELADWVRELTLERRQHPREDLISDLVAVREADDRLADDDIVATIASLLSAGTETTAMAAAFGLRTLLHHPADLEALRRDRSLLPNAVNELMRYDFGPGMLPRYLKEDIQLHGKELRKGQIVLLSFLGAHRDPAMFPDPDRFDLQRDTKALTIFGHGSHFCLGANLARAELRNVYDAALGFLPLNASLLEDRIRWREAGPIFRRMESLPVDFSAAGRRAFH